EWDPCDAAKARELYEVEQQGAYEKAEHEDLASIALGITGNKGAVHVAFGQPLEAPPEDADAVAAELDRRIWQLYVLHPTNHIAYQRLHGHWPDVPCGSAGRPFDISEHRQQARAFDERLAA